MIQSLPNENDIIRVLKGITDFQANFDASDEPMDIDGSEFAVYVSMLSTGEGEVVGAMAANAPAACMFGGGLVMLPENSLKEMIEENDLSEVVIDGLSEVFNMLRRTINAEPKNPHVEHGRVHLFGDGGGDEEWVKNPSKSIKLAGDSSLGKAEFAMVGK